jgi:hypothetical protein
MQVQKEVGQHHDDAIPSVERHRMTKNALPNLRITNGFAERHGLIRY